MKGDALVPLVDILDIDFLHDVDQPITMLHASATSPCDDLPIYDEYDDCHVESISCDAMLHRISCDNSLGHIMFAIRLTCHMLCMRSIICHICNLFIVTMHMPLK